MSTAAKMQQRPVSSPAAALSGLSSDQKKAFVAGILSYPPLTVQILLRRKTGFRQLKPTRILLMTLIMCALAYFAPDAPSDNAGGFFAPSQTQQQDSPFTSETQNQGFDAPLPSNWAHLSDGTQRAWMQQHRLKTPRAGAAAA